MEKAHQTDGTCFIVPLLPINTLTPSSDWQSHIDWLRLSGSPLLEDVADKLLSHQPIDKVALQTHMATQEHWLEVEKRISAIESYGIFEEKAAASLTKSDRQLSDDSLVAGSPEKNATASAKTGLEDYPEFCLREDPLGHAFVHDFSPEDLSRLRILAHLELAVQFEKCGLSPTFAGLKVHAPSTPKSPQSPPPPSPTAAKPKKLVKRKQSGRCGTASAAANVVTKDGVGGGNWFGVPLEVVIGSERAKLGPSVSPVPRLVSALASRIITSGLKEEGILRVSGSVQAMRQLRLHIEANGPVGQPLDEADAHDAAGLLKAFLRELPQPLLSGPYIQYYRMLDSLPTVHQRLIGLTLLIVLLPTPACLTLRVIANLLGRVLDNAQDNRMNLLAVATVMTPNLLPVELTTSLGESERLAGIVEMLVKYRSIAWRVPRTLIRQMRDSGPDQMCALFTGWTGNGGGGGGGPLPRRDPSRIAAPSQPPTEVPVVCFNEKLRQVPVEPDDTVCDLLTQLKLSSTVAEAYEVGGNVNERRLPAQARLRDLLAVNPGMKLVIKGSSSTLPRLSC